MNSFLGLDTYRHSEGTQILFSDGHAKWVFVKVLQKAPPLKTSKISG